jgi:hypothetical protein
MSRTAAVRASRAAPGRSTVSWSLAPERHWMPTLMCAYVGEGSSDPAPEATALASILVGPDPCVQARAKLKSANKAVKTAESAVSRYRKSCKSYEKKARRAHGAKRATYKRLAKRDKSRYTSAVRKRAKARGTLSAAQAAVTAAC